MSRIVEAFDRLYESVEIMYEPEIEAFLNMNDDVDPLDMIKITKDAGDVFFKELRDIEKRENDWDYIDTIYEDKKNFYKKYIDFARKCKEMSSMSGITGYGKLDAVNIKLMELCRAILYNFPYGWK